MDDAMESETKEKNSRDNVNRTDSSVLDKGTCDPVKKEVNESTLVHFTSEDQTLKTEVKTETLQNHSDHSQDEHTVSCVEY